MHQLAYSVRPSVAAAALSLLIVLPMPVPAGDDGGRGVIVLGDTQRTSFWERIVLREQNDQSREAVMRRIAEERSGLLVILGDVVTSGGDEGAWRYFDRCTATVRDSGIPIVALFGNHEYLGNPETMRSEFSSRFRMSTGKSWDVVHSQRIGFILLNSNFDELQAEELREQNFWYAAQLRRLQEDTTVSAIVVCTHHPPYTNSTIVSPSTGVEESFVPAFLATSKAALFVSGHCHSYEHFLMHGKHFLVTGGGGGPRQKVERVWRQFDDLFEGPGIRDFHYCALSVSGGRLWVRMVRMEEKTRTWSEGDLFSISLGE